MLNVLLADDEYFIRQRIKKIIKWKEWNFNFIGESENGLEVLDYCNLYNIDIILIDIQMPKMNGLDVIKYIRKNHPQIEIIVLSGYSNFEYARVALQHGVFDYLLKPIEQSHLETVLHNCRDKIKLRLENKEKIENYRRQNKKNDLLNVINGKLSFCSFTSIHPEYKSYQYTSFLSLYASQNLDKIAQQLIMTLEDAHYMVESFQESEHSYIFQFFHETKNSHHHNLITILQSFLDSTDNYIFFSLQESISINSNWKLHRIKNIKSLRMRFFYCNSYLYDSTTESPLQNQPIDLSSIQNNLTKYLNTQSIAGLRTYLSELLDNIKSARNYTGLELIILQCYILSRIQNSDSLNAQHEVSNFVTTILSEEYSIAMIQNILVKEFELTYTSTDASPSDLYTCKKIIQYVEDHYFNASLSVNTIAEEMQMNASYLGTIFKSVNNMTIIQYITQVRMTIALDLLKQRTYRVSEVANLVGYSDAFYFSKRFKQIYFCSPKDWVNNCNLN